VHIFPRSIITSACLVKAVLLLALTGLVSCRGPAQPAAPQHPVAVTEVGHAEELSAVAISRNLLFAASADKKGVVLIWELASGLEVQRLSGLTGEVVALALHPTGEQLAGADEHGKLMLWEVKSGKRLRERQLQPPQPILAYTTGGELLIGAHEDTGFVVRQEKDWRAILTLSNDPNDGPTRSLGRFADHTVLSSDGRAILHRGRLVDIASAAEKPVVPEQNPVMALGEDGATMLIWTDYGLGLFETATGKLLHVYVTGPDEGLGGIGPRSAALAGNPGLVVAGSYAAHVWQFVRDPELVPRQGGGPSTAFAGSGDGRLLVDGRADGSVSLWDVATRTVKWSIQQGGAPVTSVAISPDSRRVAAADRSGNVRLWHVSDGRLVAALPTQDDKPARIAFSPDSRQLAVAGAALVLWDAATGKQGRPLGDALQHGRFEAVDWSPDGKNLVTTGSPGRFWDVSSGKQVETLDGVEWSSDIEKVFHAPPRKSAVFSSGGETVSGSGQESVAPRSSNGQQTDPDAKNPLAIYSATRFNNDGRLSARAQRPLPPLYSAAGHVSIQDGTSRQYLRSYAAGRDGPPFDLPPFDFLSDMIAIGAQDGSIVLRLAVPDRPLKVLSGKIQHGISVAFAPGMESLATSGSYLHLWSLTGGANVRTLDVSNEEIGMLAFSPDGKKLAGTVYARPNAFVWNVETGKQILLLQSDATWETRRSSEDMPPNPIREYDFYYRPQGVIGHVAFSRDSKYLASASSNGFVELWDASSGKPVHPTWSMPGQVMMLMFTADGRRLLAVCSTGAVSTWDIDSGTEKVLANPTSGGLTAAAGSRDGRVFAVADSVGRITVWDADRYKQMQTIETDDAEIGTMALSSDGGLLAADGARAPRVWKLGAGPLHMWTLSEAGRVAISGPPGSESHGLAFSPDNTMLVTSSLDGTIRIWTVQQDRIGHMVSLYNLEDDQGAVVAPDGRFDTSSADLATGFHWIMPDDPLRALSPEIFMRDYFEPRLLSRLVACTRAGGQACTKTFAPVPPLSTLNRVRPTVEITDVRRGKAPDRALVDVRVTSAIDRGQMNGLTETGVYDVRLYRDGQLVGQWPEQAGRLPPGSAAVSRGEWREQHRVLKGSGIAVHTFEVRLPTAETGKPVTFTAYGYNDDRVKSPTSPPVAYAVPKDVMPRLPRAYVIAIGVNAYQDARRDLLFAAPDAVSLAGALRQVSRQGREYQVVPLLLVSDARRAADGQRTVQVDHATKANIRSVLLALSDPSQVQGLVHAGVAGATELRTSTPDDLVVISFSGHGLTQADGSFYLLPSDSGVGDNVNDMQKLVSSQEIAEWLRPVDAGQMLLIIDACHAGASVDTPGFKPGPMGDAGLGQLAYDKTMRVLAASQADDVALESRSLRHGLLTFALVDEGLGGETGKALADLGGNGKVEMLKWLRYGEQRVPQLYADIRSGKRRSIAGKQARPATHDGLFEMIRDAFAVTDGNTPKPHAQVPALFDFERSNSEVVLSGRPKNFNQY